MARRAARPRAEREVRLAPRLIYCIHCGKRLWVAYHAGRTLMTFRGLVQLRVVVRRCRNQECDLYHLPYRAEEEGAWALPHNERTPSPPRTRFEEDRGRVASNRTSLRSRPPGGTRAG